MTVASATNAYHGKQFAIVVELAIGGTTYRWGTAPVTDSANNYVHYDAKILDPGSIDRSLNSSPLSTGDCTMVLDNTDGDMDQFTTYTSATQSIVLGTFTIKRVEASETMANAQTLAVFNSLRVKYNRNKTVSIKMVNDDMFFGEVLTYTVGDIITELRTDFSTRFGASGADIRALSERISSLVVPYAFGNFNHRRYDGLFSNTAFLWSPTGSGAQTSIGSTTSDAALKYYVSFVALSPYGFHDENILKKYSVDGIDEGRPSIESADRTSHDFEVINLANLGNNGLDVLCFTWPASGKDSEEYQLAAVATCAAKTYANEPYQKELRTSTGGGHPLDLVQMIVEELGSADAWSASVDTANFTAIKRTTAWMESKGTIYRTEPALALAKRVADSFDIRLYMTKDGKLAAYRLDPQGKGASYSSALQYVDAYDFIGLDGEFRVDMGSRDFGIINRASFGIGPNTGGGRYWRTESREDPERWDSEPVARADNTTSQTRHARVEPQEEQRPWIATADCAQRVAERFVDLHEDPRAVLRVPAYIRGSQLELGDVVRVTESSAPGWSADRLCVVWSASDHLGTGRVSLEFVDYNDVFSAEVYLLDDEDNWVVVDGGGTITLSVTASTATVTSSAAAFTNVLAEDVLSIGGWPGAYRGSGKSNINCIIQSVDSTTQITLSSAGGEDGTLPQFTETVEAAGWRVFRGQANRDTSGGSYTAADAKYGVLCWSDSFFRDDATSGYNYGS